MPKQQLAADEKSSKILTFLKGRTIVSELSRLNKAFGIISKKQTIIGQLSDIADAAEAGKIGGGGAFMVRVNIDKNNGDNIMDKTWQEIYDALKTSSVYIISESDSDESISTESEIVFVGYNPYNDQTYEVKDTKATVFHAESADSFPIQKQ